MARNLANSDGKARWASVGMQMCMTCHAHIKYQGAYAFGNPTLAGGLNPSEKY